MSTWSVLFCIGFLVGCVAMFYMGKSSRELSDKIEGLIKSVKTTPPDNPKPEEGEPDYVSPSVLIDPLSPGFQEEMVRKEHEETMRKLNPR